MKSPETLSRRAEIVQTLWQTPEQVRPTPEQVEGTTANPALSSLAAMAPNVQSGTQVL